MHTSPNDHKQYKYIQLDNQLRVLLISDPKTPRSAASLAVNIGHFDDPIDREGMAHFLEHMLFLGTEPFPQVGEFQKYIAQHGGSNNAWTASEFTNYFFDINNSSFESGIARFSQFFISPLFSADAVDKERNAVESEYRLKINDDSRRIYQVQKETINQKHPFSQFSVGNLDTLSDRGEQEKDSIRAELIAFYQQHYSANIMSLVLLSPDSLDDLEKLAQHYFVDVPNHQKEKETINEPLVTEQQLGQFISISPLKELRKLSLQFFLPSLKPYYKSKPLTHIAHLLGYEGEGSLFSYLKSKGLVEALSAGGGISGSNYREFTISMILTKIGQSAIDEIVEAIFYYLELVKQQGINQWCYQEKRSVMEMAFQLQEQAKPINIVSHLASNIHHYHPNDIIYGDYMMETFEPELIQQLLSQITVDNMQITLISPDTIPTKEAKWYQTPYSVTALTEEQKQRWRAPQAIAALSLAKPNPFISQNLQPLAVEETASDMPILLENSEGFRLWHQQDQQFKLPKGTIYIAIDSPHAISTERNIVKTKLCIALLLDGINESAYQAEVAGLHYNIVAHQQGITLQLSGLTEKQPVLLALLIEQFKQYDFQPERFTIIKDRMLRQWKNSAKDKPISQLLNNLTGLLQPNSPPTPVLIEALNSIEFDELPLFVHSLFSELFVEVFVYGNWHQKQALEVGEQVKKSLYIEGQKYQETSRPLFMLGECGTINFPINCNHTDSAILVYHQSDDTSPESIARYILTNHLLSATFFHELRTKQQLGYMVGTSNLPLNRFPGIIFYIQSPSAVPNQLIGAIDHFLNAFSLILLELNEESWCNSKQGLIDKIAAPDTQLNAKSQRLWGSINNKDWQFSQRKNVTSAIQSFSRRDIIQFIVTQLKPRTANRLIMHYSGKKQTYQALEVGTEINSIDEFQQQHVIHEKI
ncbi:insulinase family protein [Vibrio sp. SS-MA-C1-2]|uniref:insulinase family protein n=1 Tax=Vibrio sp. SS-MA-C1-2 TaxID=2908646 RepID=UPI001F2EE849|nr:insulinase family protein [Vibrio sp. SS-MA-C1-2]UJF18726.1 insulinase family protein [Vibrio sp. SS-MA-C1-2]